MRYRKIATIIFNCEFGRLNNSHLEVGVFLNYVYTSLRVVKRNGSEPMRKTPNSTTVNYIELPGQFSVLSPDNMKWKFEPR